MMVDFRKVYHYQGKAFNCPFFAVFVMLYYSTNDGHEGRGSSKAKMKRKDGESLVPLDAFVVHCPIFLVKILPIQLIKSFDVPRKNPASNYNGIFFIMIFY